MDETLDKQEEVVLPGVMIAPEHSLELIRDKETGKPKELLWWHLALDPIGGPLDPGDPCSASAKDHTLGNKTDFDIEADDIDEDMLKDLFISPSISCYLCGRHVYLDSTQILPCNGPQRGGYIERYRA